MSHDIQLYSPSNLPVTADDPWGQSSSALTTALPPQASPMRKVQRLLRGRYLLAVSLAILGAIFGAIYGYQSQTPKFSSDATVCIKPVIPSILTNDKTVPFYDKFVQSQVNVIASQRVLEKATHSPEWKETQLGSDADMISALKQDLDIKYLINTQHIRVTYRHERPETAQAVVKAVIHAYTLLYPEINGEDIAYRINKVKEKIDELTLAQRTFQSQIDIITEKYGNDVLDIQYGNMQKRLLELEAKVENVDMLLESTQASKIAAGAGAGAGTDPNAVAELTLEQIAARDATMSAYLKTADDLKFEIDTLLISNGKNSPVVQKKAQELDLHKQRIDQYAEAFRRNFGGVTMLSPDSLQATPLTKVELANLKQASEQLHKQYDGLKTRAHELNQDNSTILRLKEKIKQCAQDLEKFNRQYDERLAEAAFGGTLQVVEDGGNPIPAGDKRKQMAFVGFLGGGAFPICLLLLIGLLDGRYRYSEEPTADMSGLQLLGILPNLPDRLTDPAQAATAAHCVHQIRTMLQINSDEDRKIYACTSARPGDGKTSLTLALGLSFAASGSRTLLIDCDLVGAGLTARLDMNGPEGVLEAMANRSLLPFIRNTDVADLAMLPVGTAQAHHAGMFSPAALRRILDEARKHFDIILIDSGPILGSIEATPACAAADGVILTVARLTPRPLVEKAMSHLTSIGAKFAGVVFNRAQARDFETSVSGISLRSIARQHETIHGRNGHANGNGGFRKADAASGGKAFGPVARAVASSVKSPDSPEHS